MDTSVRFFQGEYRFLSNFYLCPVEIEGISYPSSEHAYQALKTDDQKDRQRIAGLSTPGQAKRAGALISIPRDNPTWDSRRYKIMCRVVRAKFVQNPYLRKLLLDTGNGDLEEGNSWGDRYWGKVNGVGKNKLGKILMKIRSEFQELTNNS